MKFDILVTSDVHGYIFPTDYMSDENKDLGMLKLASLIEKQRWENENTIYIDLGDYIQGSLLASYLYEKNNPTYLIDILNDLDLDLQVLGNHGFNFGKAYLKKAINRAKYPIISANIIDKKTKKPMQKPYKILEIKGIKIAILGLTTQYIKNWELQENISDWDFLSAKATCQK